MDIDKMLSSEVQKDRLPFDMNPGAEQRLMHAAHLYTSRYTVRRNSLIEPILALFTFPLARVKVAFVALMIMFSLSTGKFIFDSNSPLQSDSTATHTMLADTLLIQQNVVVDSVIN